MFNKHLNLNLLMLVIVSGIIILVFANVTYSQVSDNNPFTMLDKVRIESLRLAKEEVNDQAFFISRQSLEEQKQEEDPLATPGKRYIVKFKEDTSMQQIFETVNLYKYKIIGKSEQRTFMIKLDDLQDFEQRTIGIIEYIEEDNEKTINFIPSDPYYLKQWALPVINMPNAWDINRGSNSVCVAVIDSGVYINHPDFAGLDIRKGWDYILDQNCYSDYNGHGTNVTGIIGAKTNNAIGIAGVNWGVTIIPLRVIRSDGTAYNSDVIKAIYDAADLGCKVINLSLGGSIYSTAANSAISYAISKGCIVVASAGNDGTSNYTYPASYNGVISVGSIDSNLSYSAFSQYNDKLDVVAPGRNIYTTAYSYYADGYEDYKYVDGTSFSAPYVSGIAALAAVCKPSITAAEFSNALKISCTDLGNPGFDIHYGYGLIDAEKMLRNFVEATLESIAITKQATKLSYTVGEPLDTTGLQVTGTYSDNSTKVENITADNITGFDSSATAVDQVLTITVGEKTTTYVVTVKAEISVAFAINTILNNTLKLGDDFFDMSSDAMKDPQGTIPIASLINDGINKNVAYFKFGGKWYAPFELTEQEFLDPAYALTDAQVNAITGFNKWYKAGSEIVDLR